MKDPSAHRSSLARIAAETGRYLAISALSTLISGGLITCYNYIQHHNRTYHEEIYRAAEKINGITSYTRLEINDTFGEVRVIKHQLWISYHLIDWDNDGLVDRIITDGKSYDREFQEGRSRGTYTPAGIDSRFNAADKELGAEKERFKNLINIRPKGNTPHSPPQINTPHGVVAMPA